MNKLALRRFWFGVHKWIGLILAILIVPLCLSGSALVWHDALDRALNPQRYAVSGDALLEPAAYAAAAARVLAPGERIAQLTMQAEAGGPVTVTAAPARPVSRPGPPQRTVVYLDPPTARVLDRASSSAGAVRFLHVLHGSLQVPGVGRTIVGWIGVAMLVSSFTGLWLWWPTVGAWARGLRWRRHRNLDSNLHHLFGFWIALPLFVLSLTGAWISFPRFFASLVGQEPSGGMGGRPAPAVPLARPALPISAAVERASALASGDLRSVAWPTNKSPDWTVTFGSGEGRPVAVAVADATGTARPAAPQARGGQGGITRLMRRIHDGDDMSPVWQAIIFLGGILPAVLAVTGIIMWWRARRWKAELARKQRERGATTVVAE